jgi:proline-specific peptidase
MKVTQRSHHVSIGDTRLYINERGYGRPILILHGGPGMDHHEFGDYLDPLAESHCLILVDQRAQGRSEMCPPETWTLAQHAADVTALAQALKLEEYIVFGHSYGAFVALQHAVDFPGAAARTIICCGIPGSRFLEHVQHSLQAFEPVEMREQVIASWEQEQHVQTPADVAALLADQLPFHFKNPLDPRIAEYNRRSFGTQYSPAVLKHFASAGYGAIEVEDRLKIIPQPVLVLAGRGDRTCSVAAAEAIQAGIPQAELVIFEESGHFPFVEESEHFLEVMRRFLK